MSDTPLTTPAVLVLGGGGILGEAWMSSLLSGLDEGAEFDARGARQYLGTSAGSIVAASLVAGLAPGSRLGHLPRAPTVEAQATSPASLGNRARGAASEAGRSAIAPLAALALSSSAAGGAALRRTALARIPTGRRSLGELGREIERVGVEFDGRLRVAVVAVETGRRHIVGAPGGLRMSVSQAVQASCAIPGVFRPVLFGGNSYVDGGAWSPTNMDAAEATRGDLVICLNPTGAFRPTLSQPASGLGPISRAAASAEALALKRRGARVATIAPDRASAAAMGTTLMDAAPRRTVIEAGLAQGRRLASRSHLRAA